MTEQSAKVKLMGHCGPIAVAADFPITDILDKLGVPYTVKTAKQLSQEWLEYQRAHPFTVSEPKPMPLPSGILFFLDSLVANGIE